jgi:hypothetical protein
MAPRILILTLLLAALGCGRVDPKIPNAKEAVRQGLKDPASAQFREMFVTWNEAVCGEVNAKNAMGGYVGFTRFIVKEDKVRMSPQIVLDDADKWLAKGFDEDWKNTCRPPGN